jgi:mersacidin/lichenicidin family type 2 lantibiotic
MKPKNKSKTIRALKDPYFRRANVRDEAKATPHPAGVVTLDDADLAHVSGAGTPTVTIPITIASVRACAALGAAALASARSGCGPKKVANAAKKLWSAHKKAESLYGNNPHWHSGTV